MLLNYGKSMPSTSRYKNSRALSAWLCVEVDTSISRGCRIPLGRVALQRMKKRI